MKTISHNGKDFTFVTTIHEISSKRFNEFEMYIIQDDGIGNGFRKLQDHLSKAILLLNEKQTEKAQGELANMYRCLHLTENSKDTSLFALASLCVEIDGEPQNDMTLDGIDKVVLLLSDLPKEQTDKLLFELKKKCIQNWSLN